MKPEVLAMATWPLDDITTHLVEHKINIHNWFTWPESSTVEKKWYCSLAVARPSVSDKVFAAGRGDTAREAILSAYDNYLNPASVVTSRHSKSGIVLSLEDLDL